MRKFAELYEQNHSWLKGWLRKRLGNPDTAADLAHDTFERVLTKPPAEDLNEPRAYLTVVAKGLVAHWYRRKAIEQTYLDALALEPEDYVPSVESQAEILERLFEIDSMLSKLPGKAREAFLMSQVDGLTYQEIANNLNVSLSTVKRYMVMGFAQCLATLT